MRVRGTSRPRSTFSRNGRTSSGPSGPPNDTTSTASKGTSAILAFIIRGTGSGGVRKAPDPVRARAYRETFSVCSGLQTFCAGAADDAWQMENVVVLPVNWSEDGTIRFTCCTPGMPGAAPHHTGAPIDWPPIVAVTTPFCAIPVPHTWIIVPGCAVVAGLFTV